MQESVVQRRCDGVQVGMTWRSRSSPKVETGGVGPARGHGHAYEAVLRFALARRISQLHNRAVWAEGAQRAVRSARRAVGCLERKVRLGREGEINGGRCKGREGNK